MAALTQDRKALTAWTGRVLSLPVAANAIPYQYGLVSENATGYAKAASATVGERVMGWSTGKVDNTGGADGAISVQVETGVILMDNDATNPVAQADVGRLCFIKDDHTVQNGLGGSSVVAGRVERVEARGVWIYVAPEIGGVSGAAIDAIPDNNTTGGVEIEHVFVIANTGANSDNDLAIKENFEVTDIIVRKQGAGAGNTVQIKKSHNAVVTVISDAIVAAVDKAVTRAGTIDPAQEVLVAGDILRATVAFAAGSTQMKVIVKGRKV
jgi:hypothetical protein